MDRDAIEQLRSKNPIPEPLPAPPRERIRDRLDEQQSTAPGLSGLIVRAARRVIRRRR